MTNSLSNTRLEQLASPPIRRRSAQNATRDLAIFKKVEIEGFTHVEVSSAFDLDRTRITQIVSRVRRELAQAAPNDPDIKDHLAQQRLQLQLEKLRLTHALEAAAKAMRRDYAVINKSRRGTRK